MKLRQTILSCAVVVASGVFIVLILKGDQTDSGTVPPLEMDGRFFDGTVTTGNPLGNRLRVHPSQGINDVPAEGLSMESALTALYGSRSKQSLKELWSDLHKNPRDANHDAILAELLAVGPVEIAEDIVEDYGKSDHATKVQYLRTFGGMLTLLKEEILKGNESYMEAMEDIQSLLLREAYRDSELSGEAYFAVMSATYDDETMVDVLEHFLMLEKRESLANFFGEEAKGLSEADVRRVWGRQLVDYTLSMKGSQARAIQGIINTLPELSPESQSEIAQGLLAQLDLDAELIENKAASEDVRLNAESLELLVANQEALLQASAAQ